MYSDLMPFLLFGVALAMAVLSLAVWRKVVASHEDDTLHVMEASALPRQVSLSHKLQIIDRWGEVLTVITVLYVIVVVALYLHRYWDQSRNFSW